MKAFLSLQGSALKRLLTSYVFLQFAIAALLACLGRLDSSTGLQLLIFQPITVLCIGSASLGLRISSQKLPKLGFSPAVWVGLSYLLTSLSESSWYEPTMSTMLKWGGLGALATILLAFRCHWISSGRRLPLRHKVTIIGVLSAVVGLAVFSICSVSYQHRINQNQFIENQTARLALLGSQIEGGQKWQALTEFSPTAQIGVFSSDGVLQFYRGNEQSRQDIKELGWRLPSPSGSYTESRNTVVWDRLASGTILLVRQNNSASLDSVLPVLLGSLLATFVVLFFVFGVAKELSSQREESFGALLERLKKGQQASAYYTWEPEVQALADQLIDWGQQLRYQRDHLQDKVATLIEKTESQSVQIASMGQRLETLKSLQESLRLDSAIPLAGKHLENLSQGATVRIWLHESGRSLLAYATEGPVPDGSPSLKMPMDSHASILGTVELIGPEVQKRQRLLQRAVQRLSPYIEQVKKVEEGELLTSLFHNLLEPKIPQIERLQAAFKYLPSKLLSGDLLDIFERENNESFVFVVADVLGKGPVAAATALRVKEHIRNMSQQGYTVSEVASQVNQRVCETDSRMLTLFIGSIDRKTRQLTYCSAGHEEVYLRDKTAKIQSLEATSMMLGVLPESEYQAKSITLGVGSQLLLFTDGVTESRDRDALQFGGEGVREAFRESKGPLHTVEILMFRLKQHCHGDFADDVSVLCLELS